MKSIGAAKFKEQCLRLFDELDPEGLVITKRGKPVARVIPYPQPPAALIGSLSDKIQINDNIDATGILWDADAQS